MLLQVLSSGCMPGCRCNAKAYLEHALQASALLCRHQKEAHDTALQQSRQDEGEEIWHLPAGLTWSDVSRVLLRCESAGALPCLCMGSIHRWLQ